MNDRPHLAHWEFQMCLYLSLPFNAYTPDWNDGFTLLRINIVRTYTNRKILPEQMEICGQFRNVCTNPYAKKKLISWRTTQWWFWWKFIGIMDLVAQSCVHFRWVKEKWISDNDNPLYDILHTYVNNRWLVGGSVGYDYWDRDYWLIIHFTTKTKNSNMKHDHRHRISHCIATAAAAGAAVRSSTYTYVCSDVSCKSTQFSEK